MPLDRRLAKNALSRFGDCMPLDPEVYRFSMSRRRRHDSASPGIDNLRLRFLESLGITGVIAYTQALSSCQAERKYP